MKEITEFRINYDYAHLLFKADEGKNLGTSVRVVELSKEDPRYNQIHILDKEVKKKYDRGFFFSWQIKRKYSKEEFDAATLLYLRIKTAFEPAGEECGTMYDEAAACEICGANRKQISPLFLKKGTIPKKDISRTIGGEVVVSEKFVNAVRQRSLKGLQLSQTNIEKYYQLIANTKIELSPNTITGNNPFEKSTGSNGGTYYFSGYKVVFEKEVYICPKGDLIGLNLLSEPYVLNSQSIGECDFFASKQLTGVKCGLLRPEPIYFCSPTFRKMVEEEKLSGFEFQIAHVE